MDRSLASYIKSININVHEPRFVFKIYELGSRLCHPRDNGNIIIRIKHTFVAKVSTGSDTDCDTKKCGLYP